MNPFLIAFLHQLEPIAIEAALTALGELYDHLEHAKGTHPQSKVVTQAMGQAAQMQAMQMPKH